MMKRISDFGFRISARPRACVGSIFCCVAVVLFCCQGLALAPAELLTPDLRAEPVHLIGIGDGRVIYFDQDRVQQTRPLDQFVQARHIGGADRPPSAAAADTFIETTDGQLLLGKPAGANKAGSAVYWTHPVLGKVAVPLTRVTRVRFADQPLPQPGDTDTVVLANGDHLQGFVEAVEAKRVLITPDGAAEAIELPRDRVAGLALANPRTEAGAGLNRLVLADGTRVWAGDLVWTADALRFELPAQEADGKPRTVKLDGQHVVRIDLASAGFALRELAAAPVQVTAGGLALGVPFPPRVVSGDPVLHAPVTVAYRLPDGAQRLRATAVLDLPPSLPEDRRALAHCELVVHHGPGQSAIFTLSPDAPSAEVNLPITGQTLSIGVREGDFGPILDRVRLLDAVVLVAGEAE